ncbi:hypothetical protein HY971_04860 [Candidatus Kaiserbacteria bacterium]|nr:hypothetical protein [Candidatus Kaiserbacteria bacterium]
MKMAESFFTRHTKERFSGKTKEQTELLRRRELAYDTAALEEAAGPLEKIAGQQLRKVVEKGLEDPESYERFVPHFEQCTDAPVLTLVFGSLDDPAYIDQSPNERPELLTTLYQSVVEKKVPKLGTLAQAAFTLPIMSDMYPAEGLRCTFRGPAARAASSAEQLNRMGQAVLEGALEVAENFLEIHGPDAKINVWGFSAGTQDAMFVTRFLGDMLGRPVDDCTLVSPGLGMGLGIFAAWPVNLAADKLREKGFTPQSFHEATYKYSQEAQLKEGKNNPRGRNFKVIYGTSDTIIPPFQPGGTIDFINLARKQGLAPTVIEYKGLDHITMPGELMWQKAYGNDPTFERNRPSLWSIPETYSDPLCIRKLDDIFSRFSAEELPFFAELVSERNGMTIMDDMEPHMHAIADWLVKHEICNVATGPRYLWVRNKEDLVDKIDPSIKSFRKQIVAHELPRVLRELSAIDHDESFKPLYEMTQEEKRPKLISEANSQTG